MYLGLSYCGSAVFFFFHFVAMAIVSKQYRHVGFNRWSSITNGTSCHRQSLKTSGSVEMKGMLGETTNSSANGHAFVRDLVCVVLFYPNTNVYCNYEQNRRSKTNKTFLQRSIVLQLPRTEKYFSFCLSLRTTKTVTSQGLGLKLSGVPELH